VTPILMYHSISSDAARRFRPFAVCPRRFEEHVRYIKEQGYQTITVSDFVRRRQVGADAFPKKTVVLTFDDGFADFHQTALPVLTKYGLTATLYIVSGCVGGTSRWLGQNSAGSRLMLDWPQLSEIAKGGIEIGSHTVSHPALDALSIGDAKAEILHSKYHLQDRLGVEINAFAYPYGYYSKAVRDLVLSAGYTSACAVRYAASSAKDDRFALSRHIVRQDINIARLEVLLANSGVDIRTAFDRARSATWACLRHALYSGRHLAGVHHG
jgi:peptidoglycan/xylan/chitin deacetylase (PgdA/CDA1 family)